jgi:uncharacterized membrane protein YhaH (DUF805 family)
MWDLFSFRGRTSRLGYWRAQLLSIVVATVAWAGGLFAMLGVGPIGGVLFALLPAALLISVATAVRRLHDRGKGLWWALLFLAGPLALTGLAQALTGQHTDAGALESLPVLLAALVLNIWALIEVGFVRGPPGANQFGQPPAR